MKRENVDVGNPLQKENRYPLEAISPSFKNLVRNRHFFRKTEEDVLISYSGEFNRFEFIQKKKNSREDKKKLKLKKKKEGRR